MKTKAFVLYIILLALTCRFSLGKLQNSGKTTAETENSIVFNGWYHSGKEQWQGTHHNKLLFTWYIKRTSANSPYEYGQLVARQRRNGVKLIGYSYSSIVSAPLSSIGGKVDFPEGTIPPEAIRYSWILRDANGQLVNWRGKKDNYILDIGKKDVQDAILLRAISNAKSLDSDVLFLDNWNYKSWAPPGQTIEQWAKKNQAFIIRARELTNRHNLKLIVNQASPLQYWHVFAPYLDGFSYEMSTHKNYLQEKDRYKLELDTYEKMMAMGKSIFLFTYRSPGPNRLWEPDGRKTAATAMLVMPENQPYWGGIYVCPPIYEVWPIGGWPMWPEQLGKPLGPRKWNGDTVTRRFEHGSISVTVGQNPKFNISLEY